MMHVMKIIIVNYDNKAYLFLINLLVAWYPTDEKKENWLSENLVLC